MTEALSESQWLERALQGDVDAFGELVRLYERPVFNLAYRMLGDGSEAEDAAQEAFLKAYANLYRYDASRPFKTWLLSITSNHCIDCLRKRRLTWLSLEDEPVSPHPALVSDHQLEPEAAAIAHEHSRQVQKLLTTLPDDYRAVVILHYWYDYSYAEIAVMLDTSESAIKSRLFRARQVLAKQMDPETMFMLNRTLENG